MDSFENKLSDMMIHSASKDEIQPFILVNEIILMKIGELLSYCAHSKMPMRILNMVNLILSAYSDQQKLLGLLTENMDEGDTINISHFQQLQEIQIEKLLEYVHKSLG